MLFELSIQMSHRFPFHVYLGYIGDFWEVFGQKAQKIDWISNNFLIQCTQSSLVSETRRQSIGTFVSAGSTVRGNAIFASNKWGCLSQTASLGCFCTIWSTFEKFVIFSSLDLLQGCQHIFELLFLDWSQRAAILDKLVWLVGASHIDFF